MELRLSASGSAKKVDDFVINFSPEPRSVSVGRGAANDWVLPDDSKVLSGTHAVFSNRGSSVSLEDTSTNGVFVNFSGNPLGRGNSTKLQNGDCLVMGDYEITVSLSNYEQAAQAPADVAGLITRPSATKPRPDPLDLLSQQDEKPRSVDDILNSGELGPPVAKDTPDPLTDMQANRVHDVLSAGRDNSQAVKGAYQAPKQASHVAEEPPAAVDVASREAPPAHQGDLLKPFFAALGIDQPAMSPEDLAVLLGEAGAALAEVMSGLAGIADAPGRLSEEFGVGRPRLHPVEDNPLKSSQSAEQLAESFFGCQRRRNLLPSAAFRESLSEVADHQTALLAAVRSAYAALLPCFEPKTLQERFSRYGGANAQGLEADAWMWDMYQRYYADLVREERQGLARLFSDVFGRAYHEHMAVNVSVARAAAPAKTNSVSGGTDDLSALLGSAGGGLR